MGETILRHAKRFPCLVPFTTYPLGVQQGMLEYGVPSQRGIFMKQAPYREKLEIIPVLFPQPVSDLACDSYFVMVVFEQCQPLLPVKYCGKASVVSRE